MLVIMYGLTATGKSTLAKKLSKNLGADLYQTAVIRGELGLDSGFSFLLEDEGFTRQVSPKVYSEMMKRARESLEGGRDVVLDGSFCMGWEREMAYKLGRETGQQLVILECILDDIEEIKRRLEERRARKGPLSEAKDMRTYYSLKEGGDPLTKSEVERVCLVRVDTKRWKAYTERVDPPPSLIDALDRMNIAIRRS